MITVSKLPVINSDISCSIAAHSSVNADSLALQETIPMVGVPFSLNYSSDRILSDSHFLPQTLGLGAWSPSLVHHYDIASNLLYYGDGGVRSVMAQATSDGYYLSNRLGTEVYFFNQNGVHIQTKDALTGILKYRFTYDSNGRLVGISDQFNNTTTLQYAANTVTVTSPYGQVSLLKLDGNGFLASISNPNNETYSVTHNASGLMTSFTKPGGAKSIVTYDSNGNVLKDQGAGGDFISLMRSFDSQNMSQTVTVSTAMNRQTIYRTSAASSSASSHEVVNSSGETSRFTNSSQGNNTATYTLGDTYLSSQAQDPRFGWMSPYESSSNYQIPGSNIQISIQKNQTAQLSDPTDPLSVQSLTLTSTLQNDPTRTSFSTYDASKKLWTSKSPMKRVAYKALNSQGLIANMQFGTLTPISFTYDNRGRLNSTIQGDRKSNINYDSNGNIASVSDSLGRLTRYQYDKANRIKQTSLSDGNIVSMTYDSNGNMTSITPPGKRAHAFFYNMYELIGSYLPPSINAQFSGATNYSYNLDRQVTTISRPDGKVLSFNYDAKSGLLSSLSSGDIQTQYVYNGTSSQISSITSVDGEKLTYSYTGPLLRSVTSSGPVQGQVNFSYGSDGSISAVGVQKGNSVGYNYDKDTLVTGAGNESLTRDPATGLPTNINLGVTNESLTYNNFGEVLSSTVKVKGKNIYSYALGRDKLGRIVTKNERVMHENIDLNLAYSYDSVGRLSSTKMGYATISLYTYDSNGNRISKKSPLSPTETGIYDDQDRLVQYGRYQYTYNANGDRLSKQNTKDKDNNISYTYDAIGNLKSVNMNSGKRKIHYIVDGQNRRVGKIINGKIVSQYLYQSQLQLAAELDGSGRLIKQFVYASKTNIPDYMITPKGTYRIISDSIGTPRLVIDTANGHVVDVIVYDEFGNLVVENNPGTLPFGLAGGLYDADTKLVHFGAREYDPEIGRWISKDPIGFAGGDTNLYGYVANDPINWTDPTGLARGDWWDPRTYVYPVVEAGQGTGDFVRNYNNMRSANTIGADKYFHCMANCQATQRGPGGQTAAEIIGEGRELTDQYIKGDSRQECDKDRAANAQGRNGAGGGACSQVCGSLRPNGLSSQW